MSAEKYARRALWTVIIAKQIRDGLSGVGSMLVQAGRVLDRQAESAFLVECDAARRYKAATGYDLGGAAGYPARYIDNPEEFAREGLEPGEFEDEV